jgi:hypothetical protein
MSALRASEVDPRPVVALGVEGAPPIALSVVIPLYNEEDNVDLAVAEVLGVLDTMPEPAELILVDDGSRDATLALARSWAERDGRVRVIAFRRNFGQTAGISAGFDHARGAVVIVLDGDQQNDPADIPRLLQAMGEGYDVVSGWRARRQDTYLLRRLPSKVANALISAVTGVKLHDYGCTLKAYDAAVVRNLHLYGELHRFIPALAVMSGARVLELPVNHRPRTRGVSKYGISRLPRVLLDLLTVKFLLAYLQRPMQFFGRLAGACLAGGALRLVAVEAAAALRSGAGSGDGSTKRRHVGVSAVLGAAAVQFLCFGLIGELLTRVYHEGTARRPYAIRSTVGFDDEGAR